jgi:hypothetical protein
MTPHEQQPALARWGHDPVERSQWDVMREQAEVLVRTGFLPREIQTAERALAVILKGRELRIPPMHALASIAIVSGKPVCSAELMLALAYRDHGDDAVRFEESTPERCVVSYKRRSWTERQSYAFTIEDAARAGLTEGNWRKYPQAMLRARCMSAVARLAFPDSIAGMYTPEELGAPVSVDEDGQAGLGALPEPPPPPAPAPAPVEHARATPPPPQPAPAPRPDPGPPPFAEPAPDLLHHPDEVDTWAGDQLIDACALVAERLASAGIAGGPMPNPRTLRSLRTWYRTGYASLTARPGQPALLVAPSRPPPSHYDEEATSHRRGR